MVASGAVHAAPMELERMLGCAVTINMSLLRSWRWIGQGRKAAPERPNPASAVDGGIASLAYHDPVAGRMISVSDLLWPSVLGILNSVVNDKVAMGLHASSPPVNARLCPALIPCRAQTN